MNPTDPATLIQHLDSAAILARLAELDREARALRVLLRAARARERGRRPVAPEPAHTTEARGEH